MSAGDIKGLRADIAKVHEKLDRHFEQQQEHNRDLSNRVVALETINTQSNRLNSKVWEAFVKLGPWLISAAAAVWVWLKGSGNG